MFLALVCGTADIELDSWPVVYLVGSVFEILVEELLLSLNVVFLVIFTPFPAALEDGQRFAGRGGGIIIAYVYHQVLVLGSKVTPRFYSTTKVQSKA